MQDTDFEYPISGLENTSNAEESEKTSLTADGDQGVDLETLEMALTFLELTAQDQDYDIGTPAQDSEAV